MTSEALIVGGGPAGASLAILLARAGRRVTLLERESGPHDKVCGEFISHEAAGHLRALGLDLAALGAVRISAVRLAARGEPAEETLPFPAFSLSRRRLDEALLRLAEQAGAQVRRGVRVKRLTPTEDDFWVAELDGGAMETRAAFLATGKHDIKSHKRPQGLHGDLVGFKMHWRLAPAQAEALGERVELSLFPDGYGGLEPIEDGLANLCLLMRKTVVRQGPSWDVMLGLIRETCPSLDRRLKGARPAWAKPLAISAIPFGHVQRRADGVWRLGDQAAVIPSFAGDGLAIALHSARAAAEAHLAGRSAEDYQQALARDLRWQVQGAALLSHALVQPRAQGAIAAAARLQPRLLAAAAKRTRIPPKALDRASPCASGSPRPLRPAAARRGRAGSSLPSGRR